MWFELLRGFVLGAVQGLTEFFPVSSSGHLILVPILFGWKDQGLAFDTVLHLGTLIALFWFFWKDIVSLIRRRAWGFLLKVVVATLPAAVIGFLLNDFIEEHLRLSWLVAVDTAIWALVLLAADRYASRNKSSLEDFEKVSWKQALAVGFAQPLALAPGTSRSGITMTAGLFSGLSRQAAAKFSFFLSIPITAAAGLSGLVNVAKHGTGTDGTLALVVGFFSALGFGIFAIRFLISYVAKRHFDGFVAYRLALALVVFLIA